MTQTTDVEAIQQDASQVDGPDSITDMILKNLEDDHDGLSENSVQDDLEAPEAEDNADPEDDHEGPSEGEAENEDEGTEEQDAPEPKAAKRITDEDAVYTVKVGDEEIDVPVADLARLYGQEKALTRKTQEASEKKRQAEERLDQLEASLSHHFQMALDDYKQYEGENFAVRALSEGWDADTLDLVMKQEARARQRLEYFHNELAHVTHSKQQHVSAEAQRLTQATITELNDPVHGIKGFGPDMVRDLVEYATKDLGFSREYAETMGSRSDDAKLVKALHRLMTLERGQKALATKTAKPKAAPTKVIKSRPEPEAHSPGDDYNRAMTRLKRDNSPEAIRAAIRANLLS